MNIPRRVREHRRRNSANSQRNFGRRCALCSVMCLRTEHEGVAVNRWLRLFIKNTALCKHESGRIGCDACPVPAGKVMGGKLLIEATVNSGRNYNGPKVAKFLVG